MTMTDLRSASSESPPASGPRPVPRTLPDEDRLRLFAEALDQLRQETFARVGADDVRHIKRVRRFSLAMEIVGRTAIHLSLEPLTFVAGVGALWLHKQLEATEIGHTALHGAYDRLEGAEAFASKTFRWDIPIDEESWRLGHNVRHHGSTNVAGRDPDMRFGPVRLTEQHAPASKHQLAVLLGIDLPELRVRDEHALHRAQRLVSAATSDVVKERSPEVLRTAWRKSLRKYVPYYLKNYVLFPALAGPFFWKVLLGNVLAEVMRDVYSAATIVCGHVGDDVKSWPPGTQAASRGATGTRCRSRRPTTSR